jgi:hypothetical protein
MPTRNPIIEILGSALPDLPDALCAQPEVDPSLWFPTDTRHEIAAYRLASCICAACPELLRCREFALSHPQAATDGMWAGMTPYERSAIIKSRRRLKI